MPEFHTSQIVNFTADEMFDLVADVERYPEFVPLCGALAVRECKMHDDGRQTIIADMSIAYKLLKESFVTRVELAADRRQIDTEYIDGPFSYLKNRWSFEPLEEGRCRIGFYITYEFKSRTFSLLMRTVFDHAFRKINRAFESRAQLIYRAA